MSISCEPVATEKRTKQRSHFIGMPPSISVSESQMVQMSKTLSWLLRHGIQTTGIEMGSDGFVPVDDVLEYFRSSSKCRSIPSKLWTIQSINAIVESDKKSRYRLQTNSDGVLFIRAQQGHSIKEVLDDNAMLKPITLQNVVEFPIAVHGTTEEKWTKIQKDGELNAGQRIHIHFAQGLQNEQGVKSGMRLSSDVYLYIDLKRALEAGYLFYVSGNGVILCSGLPDKGAAATVQRKVIPVFFSSLSTDKFHQRDSEKTETALGILKAYTN